MKVQEKPEVDTLWDDRDSRMNRRVKVVAVLDPQGVQVEPYVLVENVTGSKPMEADVPSPSPAGHRAMVKLSRFRYAFARYVEAE